MGNSPSRRPHPASTCTTTATTTVPLNMSAVPSARAHVEPVITYLPLEQAFQVQDIRSLYYHYCADASDIRYKMHLAAKYGYKELLAILINKYPLAELDLKGTFNFTCLWGQLDVFEYLHPYIRDDMTSDDYNSCLLHVASSPSQNIGGLVRIARQLLDMGATDRIGAMKIARMSSNTALTESLGRL